MSTIISQEKLSATKISRDPLFFLYQESYGTYSRPLARKLGLAASVLLSELTDKRRYHTTRNELIDDERHGKGWFYQTHDSCEERTGLSRKEQDTALKILKENNLIEMQVFGLPAKRHFRLNELNILDFFGFSNNNSSLSVSGKLGCPKGANYDDRKGQTALYIEEPKEEPKYDICENASISARPKALEKRNRNTRPIIKFIEIPNFPLIQVLEEQHQKLLAKHGESLLKEIYQYLNDWKESKAQVNPKALTEHTDYHRINKWVYTSLMEQKNKKTFSQKTPETQQQQLAEDDEISKKHFQISGYRKRCWEEIKKRNIIFEILANHVQIGNDRIYFDAFNYKDLILNALRKVGLPLS